MGFSIAAVVVFSLSGCGGTDKNGENISKEVSGRTLPPEPDLDQNNATLLGIDSNDNGIRDDVERSIIVKYVDKVKVELMFQYARVDQKILGSDLTKEKAMELEAEGGKAINCRMYLKHKDIKVKRAAKNSERLTYNTKERVKKYIEYNKLLSGGVFGGSKGDWQADACDFDVDLLLEEKK